jgi:hypothetical protein
MRGRTALYGPRHLLQLVAVKRRQAQGHSLAAIQAELHGASNAELAVAARVPENLLAVTGDEPATDGPVRSRFWATAAAAPQAGADPSPQADVLAGPPPRADVLAVPAPVAAAVGRPGPAAARARPLGGVALGRGAILVLPVRPEAADYAAIATAARPLLDLLAARGLLAGDTLDDGSAS